MPRRPRPLTREADELRDCRLIIIASEDRYAAEQYFALFRSRRVQVKVIPTPESGHSSPPDVLARLEDYKAEYDLHEDDQLWLCLDTDHWVQPNHIQNLTQTLREATHKGVRLAISNPCFDLWLLLHHAELGEAPVDTDCDAVGVMIRQTLGEFNK